MCLERDRVRYRDTEKRLKNIDCIFLKEYYANSKNIIEWIRKIIKIILSQVCNIM